MQGNMTTIQERAFVQWIIRVWFQEEVLQANHDRRQVQHRVPIFSKDIQTNISFEIDIGMIYLIKKVRNFIKGVSEKRTVCVHLTFGGSCG